VGDGLPVIRENEEGRLQAAHASVHVAARRGQRGSLESVSRCASARGRYDIVLNGVELGSGSIRIHDPELQAKLFKALGLPADEIEERSGI